MNNIWEAVQHGEFYLLFLEPMTAFWYVMNSASILSKMISSAKRECLRLGLFWKYRYSWLLPTNIYGVFGFTASSTAMM